MSAAAVALIAIFGGACVNPDVFRPPTTFPTNVTPVPSRCSPLADRDQNATPDGIKCRNANPVFRLTICIAAGNCHTGGTYPTMQSCLTAVGGNKLSEYEKSGTTSYCSAKY